MKLSDLDDRMLHLQANAIEKSTVKGYATGARDYITFCMSHHLSIEPTPETLAHYVAYTSQFIASAPKYLSGVRHFLSDIYPDFDKNCAHPLVTTTIRGSKKIHADPICRKLPLHPAHLQTFLHIAHASWSYDDLLFATIMSCLFYACHCSGELIQKNSKDLFNWRKIIKRSSLTFAHGRAQYHLPYHKGDPFYHGTDILFSHQEVADPVALLHEYIDRRDSVHGACLALFL